MPEIKLVLQIIPSINDISKTAVNGIIHSSNIPKQLSSAQSESLEEIQQIPNSVTELQLCDPTDNMKLIKNKVQTTYLKIFKTDVGIIFWFINHSGCIIRNKVMWCYLHIFIIHHTDGLFVIFISFLLYSRYHLNIGKSIYLILTLASSRRRRLSCTVVRLVKQIMHISFMNAISMICFKFDYISDITISEYFRRSKVK
ncbi:hypothetical protein AGLY_014768 [Aphis glycines]|uniref:Uncharacterized protein n=1 Tax=Aphis glycines TaxID=307491 RepID=A0A6G0T2T6_APHGL|nr:hypothetical protein AGLY_014768 [Aphis glycines]